MFKTVGKALAIAVLVTSCVTAQAQESDRRIGAKDVIFFEGTERPWKVYGSLVNKKVMECSARGVINSNVGLLNFGMVQNVLPKKMVEMYYRITAPKGTFDHYDKKKKHIATVTYSNGKSLNLPMVVYSDTFVVIPKLGVEHIDYILSSKEMLIEMGVSTIQLRLGNPEDTIKDMNACFDRVKSISKSMRENTPSKDSGI